MTIWGKTGGMPAVVGSCPHKLRAARLAIAIGAELRRLRLSAGLTQEQVAQFIESHRPIITRIERGKHMPTLEVAELMAAVCGGDARDVLRVVDRVCGLRRRRVSARAQRNRTELAA